MPGHQSRGSLDHAAFSGKPSQTHPNDEFIGAVIWRGPSPVQSRPPVHERTISMIPPDMREEWIIRQARERPTAERAAFLPKSCSESHQARRGHQGRGDGLEPERQRQAVFASPANATKNLHFSRNSSPQTLQDEDEALVAARTYDRDRVTGLKQTKQRSVKRSIKKSRKHSWRIEPNN